MPIVTTDTTVTGYAAADDASCSFDVAPTTYLDTTYMRIRSTATTSARQVAGIRFVIPATVDAAYITKVQLFINPQTTGTLLASELAFDVISNPDVFANTTTGRPAYRSTNCTLHASGWQAWGTTGSPISTTANTQVSSPTGTVETNLGAQLAAVMGTSGWDANGRHAVLYVRGYGSGAVTNFDFSSLSNATTGYRPFLRITEDRPATNATVTLGVDCTTPMATASVTNGLIYREVEDIAYDDGYAHSSLQTAERYVDWSEPPGTAPANGWPLVVFIHGGAFSAGSDEQAQQRQREAALAAGYAFASVRYWLTDATAGSNTGANHPQPVQDALAAVGHLVANYDVDPYKVVWTGHSAGGHIALEAALHCGDSNTYSYSYTDGGNRHTLGPSSSGSYTYHQGSAQRLALKKPLGCFLYGAPIDPRLVGSDFSYQGVAYNAFRWYNGGRDQGLFSFTNWSAGYTAGAAHQNGEMNLADQIRGDAAGVYAGQSLWTFTPSTPSTRYKRRLPDFPIGFVEAYVDATVGQSGAVDALRDALTAVNVPVATRPSAPGSGAISPASGGVQTGGGMSHWTYNTATGDDHTYVYNGTKGQTVAFTTWLATLETYVPVVMEAPVAEAFVVAPTVTIGTGLSQVSLSGGTAPAGAVGPKDAARGLAGASTPTSALSMTKVVLQALAGATAAVGALLRATSRAASGASAGVGAPIRLTDKRTAGATFTPTGATSRLKALTRAFAGATAAVGAIVRQTGLPRSGATAATGTAVRQPGKVTAGATATTGASTRWTRRTSTATLTTSGTLAAIKTVLQSVAGGLTATGALTAQLLSSVVQRTMTAVLTLTGVRQSTVDKGLAGGVTPATTHRRTVASVLAGAVAATGTTVASIVAQVVLSFQKGRRRPDFTRATRRESTE